MKKIQRYERETTYSDPIHCVFCGAQVYSEEFEMTPCEHTLFMADDIGFHALAPRVIEQLTAKGYEVTQYDDIFEVEGDESPEEITDLLEFEDALKIASYSGPPSRDGFYVGFAPNIQWVNDSD